MATAKYVDISKRITSIMKVRSVIYIVLLYIYSTVIYIVLLYIVLLYIVMLIYLIVNGQIIHFLNVKMCNVFNERIAQETVYTEYCFDSLRS